MILMKKDVFKGSLLKKREKGINEPNVKYWRKKYKI
jgi:hypothetical protein